MIQSRGVRAICLEQKHGLQGGTPETLCHILRCVDHPIPEKGLAKFSSSEIRMRILDCLKAERLGYTRKVVLGMKSSVDEQLLQNRRMIFVEGPLFKLLATKNIMAANQVIEILGGDVCTSAEDALCQRRLIEEGLVARETRGQNIHGVSRVIMEQAASKAVIALSNAESIVMTFELAREIMISDVKIEPPFTNICQGEPNAIVVP